MPIIIDEYTRQRVLREKYGGDINYDLISDQLAIKEEDVPLIGSWEDWTGSGIAPTRSQMMYGGITNGLQGTDAHIVDNAKLPNLTVRGTRSQTNRQRVIKRNHE
jgi:hypothetical protein